MRYLSGGWKYLHIIQERYNIINIYNNNIIIICLDKPRTQGSLQEEELGKASNYII